MGVHRNGAAAVFCGWGMERSTLVGIAAGLLPFGRFQHIMKWIISVCFQGVRACREADEEDTMDSLKTRRQTIMIADDSEMNREILADMLGDAYDLIEAADGEEAVGLLREREIGVDLLLLDIMMPKLDGFGVLAAMNEHHWIDHIPVIMISAESASSFVDKAYEQGATDYISRPFDAAVVRRRVTNTLMLYGRQKRLVQMVADQVYEREKSGSLMTAILSHIVEFRNGESGKHVVHIQTMTDLICRYLSSHDERYAMSQEEINIISIASALHDIGKISIPEEVLNKPGRFTPEEFAVMKTHAAAGAAMLEALPDCQNEPLVKRAWEICRWHHERWDGRGYPDGLAGDEIPISAQIVSLADVYDALTSERCYKRAFTHEKAIEMILNGECGAFNPVLLTCLKEVADILRTSLQHGFDALRADQQSSGIVEELLGRRGLTEAGRSYHLMEVEREKSRFFLDRVEEIQFDYNAETDMLNLSEWGARLLGLERVTVHPVRDALGLMGKENLDAFIAALRASTPEKPDVEMEMLLVIHGEARWYRLVARSIWEKKDALRYVGVIGKFSDIHEEYLRRAGETTEAPEQGMLRTTSAGAACLIRQLRCVFDTVRLVDPRKNIQVAMTEDGQLREGEGCPPCYALWNRQERCDECISRRAFERRTQMTKLEFTDEDIYEVTAKYLEIDGAPYVMEMISRVRDSILLGGYGKDDFVRKISRYNKERCTDPMTGVYNRRYFEENLEMLEGVDAVAMIDADDFKHINDTYGHLAGDAALKAIASAISSGIRESDALIRYGGDEFLLLFQHIPAEKFQDKLEQIRQRVSCAKVEGYPDIRLTISVGGVHSASTMLEAVKRADQLMYRAKARKNAVETQK